MKHADGAYSAEGLPTFQKEPGINNVLVRLVPFEFEAGIDEQVDVFIQGVFFAPALGYIEFRRAADAAEFPLIPQRSCPLLLVIS